MLLFQSIMCVSTLLQALPDLWTGQGTVELPVGYGTVKQTALICLREAIPELHCPWSDLLTAPGLGD